MASRPLYNGSARVSADNNGLPATLNRYTFRASVAALPTGDETIGNATFEAKAGVGITLNYDIRKFGSGAALGAPGFARLRIFLSDDNNNGTTVAGDEFQSADLIGGANLPLTGTVSFTPSKHGTYRIALELRRGAGDFSATSQDWTIHSDGLFQNGGLSQMVRAFVQDKGRLRWGHDLSSVTVTERGSAPPSKFAVTMNAGGTAHQEAVRIDTAHSHSQNKSVAAQNVFQIRQRRNGTSTVDVDAQTTIQSATAHRTETVVDRLSYPNEGENQSYDVVVAVASLSVLHTANTPQYTGLGGQSADGVWTYFAGVGAGLTLTDYKTVTKLATHNVDAGGSIENIGSYSAALYAEDANGIPTVAEKFSYIFTDDNMTVKSGRVLNSRSEALFGVFVVHEVIHEASSTNLTTWGNNDIAFKTRSNGWQLTARTVTVTTPPAGIYKLTATALFPGTAFGTPGARTFSASRIEQGSPAGITTGKDWIAPASFSTAWIVGMDPVMGGVTYTFGVNVFDKNVGGSMVLVDADFIPTITVTKRDGANTMQPFSTPVAVAVATGQYIFTFTPSVVPPGGVDIYLITADVMVGSFKRRWGEDVTGISYDIAKDRFDAVAFATGGKIGFK